MQAIRITLAVIALLAAVIAAPMVVSAVFEVPSAAACGAGNGGCF